MRLGVLRSVVAALVLATALATVPATTASAGDTVVTAADMQFASPVDGVFIGQSVTWEFPEATVHTTTSDEGFWDSGPRSDGETFVHRFDSAGSYPYACSFHPSMTGLINVKMRISGSVHTGWRVRWAITPGSATTTYDVELRKPGLHHVWRMVRTATTTTSMPLNRKGTWSVRARTTQADSTSRWSPVTKLTTL